MTKLSPKQMRIFQAFAKHEYYPLSASEAADPEIEELFSRGLVEQYYGTFTIWHLSRKGRELGAELELLTSTNQLVIEASTGKIKEIP